MVDSNNDSESTLKKKRKTTYKNRIIDDKLNDGIKCKKTTQPSLISIDRYNIGPWTRSDDIVCKVYYKKKENYCRNI